MRFTQWILGLEDEKGILDRFQKVAFGDINNGCASSKFDALGWKQHFLEKHPDSAEDLIALLTKAYAKYALSNEGK